ncbi:MAG: hypothetical protein ACOH1Y_16250 [Propionicimonas sp.]
MANPRPLTDPVAAAARDRVNADYAAHNQWVPTAEQIQIFLHTKEALHNYVADIACEIGVARLKADDREYCLGTRPWLDDITQDQVVLNYYADNSDRLDFRYSKIYVRIADVLPEFVKYQAIAAALTL